MSFVKKKELNSISYLKVIVYIRAGLNNLFIISLILMKKISAALLCLMFQEEESFCKRLPCNWTSGYKWSTALTLRYVL